MKPKYLPMLLFLLYTTNFAHAENNKHQWQGEWGSWQSENNGANISIRHCDENDICELKFNIKHDDIWCANYRPFKMVANVDTNAMSLDPNCDGCNVSLTKEGVGKAAVIHATFTGCDGQCYYGRGNGTDFPPDYPWRSNVNYPETNKSACYFSSSNAMKTWCEASSLAEADNKIVHLNEHIEKLTDYKQSFDVKKWQAKTIGFCNTAKEPALTCLTLLYNKKIAELSLLEKSVMKEHEVSLKKIQISADPELASKIINEMEGVYKYRFKNGNVSGDYYPSEDILEIVRVNKNTIYFKVHTEFSNANECKLFGLAKYTQDNKFVYIGKIDRDTDPECIFSIARKGDNIIFEASTTCQNHCGPRGVLSMSNFKMNQRRKIRYMKIILNSEEYKNSLKNYVS